MGGYFRARTRPNGYRRKYSNFKEVREEYVFHQVALGQYLPITVAFPCQLLFQQFSLFILPSSGKQAMVPLKAVFPNKQSLANTRINKCTSRLHGTVTGHDCTKRKARIDVLSKE
jgi:hypothetical protein